MKRPSTLLGKLTLGVLLLSSFGCDGGDGGGRGSPTATRTTAPSATPTVTVPPTPSSTPTPTNPPIPTATPTPTTSGELDIAICAPDAGPFSAEIDNPFFPLPVGTQWVLTGEEDGAPVRVVISSLADTEVVAGVTTRVVEEREWQDAELVEVSRNFFAQTADGTVCYYGEDVDDYEAGEIVGHDGAWRAGVNGALPGILIPAHPEVGQTFRQEVAAGVAEDEAEQVAAGESVTVGLGTFTDTIRYEEMSLLDNGTSEKVYARDVGLLTDDTLERIPMSLTFCGTLDGEGCAADQERVDLGERSFSNPTNVDNPLFPISNLRSAVILGNEGDEPLRIEVTLLPDPFTVDVDGRQIETLVSQFVAYLDGRLSEVALDKYGQADDGSVFYFGEDVFNYDEGILADTSGTWLAGRDGPAAMIMPANPQVGDVYRTENIPGLVFEEVTVKTTGLTVDGPYGPVAGAIMADELHLEGDHEDKTFAPGYGEFLSGDATSLEALSLAVPTDALATPLPAELATLLSGADDIFDAAEAEEWSAAATTLESMRAAFETYRTGGVSARLGEQLSDALEALGDEIDNEDTVEARNAAIQVSRATLDFHLRHRPPIEVDLARFDLWVRQILVDAEDDDPEGVDGNVTTLGWIRDRFRHALEDSDASAIDALLAELRAAADEEDLSAATGAAERLRDELATVELMG